MKITAQEEYGIRILLRIADSKNPDGITIPKLSEVEGLSAHYTAKLCRILRLNGFIRSTRGKEGGYFLARPAQQININQVLTVLGGKLYSEDFCKNHTGQLQDCCHKCSCSVRSLWQVLQQAVDDILNDYTLQDLLNSENGTAVLPAPDFQKIPELSEFQKSDN